MINAEEAQAISEITLENIVEKISLDIINEAKKFKTILYYDRPDYYNLKGRSDDLLDEVVETLEKAGFNVKVAHESLVINWEY